MNATMTTQSIKSEANVSTNDRRKRVRHNSDQILCKVEYILGMLDATPAAMSFFEGHGVRSIGKYRQLLRDSVLKTNKEVINRVNRLHREMWGTPSIRKLFTDTGVPNCTTFKRWIQVIYR